MTYVYLALAVVFEVGWAVAMKLSNGFTRGPATAATLVLYMLSLGALTMAVKKLDVGAAYAVWAGLGAAIIAIIGIYYFKESAPPLKVVSLVLVVVGIVGLNISDMGR